MERKRNYQKMKKIVFILLSFSIFVTPSCKSGGNQNQNQPTPIEIGKEYYPPIVDYAN